MARTYSPEQSDRYCASVGFSLPTREVIYPPSFEIGNLQEGGVDRVEIDCDLANASRKRR